ncbi:MAG TPA: methyltransferase domain-containing protein [Polyangiaceae bacterium]
MPRSQPKKPLPLLEPAENEWLIAKLVPGGAGFLRLSSGQGAFAPGALPGERIRVEQVEDHKTYLQATRWSLLERSPNRVEPSCPVQQQCGGCDLMTFGYAAQVDAKAGILREALTRTGRFEQLPELRFVSSPEPLHYRTRIRLHVATGARIGFYAAESRDLVEIPGCLVAHPELDAALRTLRDIARRHAVDVAKLSELELRVAPGGPRLAVHLIPAERSFDPARPLVAALARSFEVSIAERASDPERDQRYPLPGGVQLRVSGGGFNQVNWAVNQLLVQALLDGAERVSALSFCDLYCGAGNFSLPLLARGLVGLGIENSRSAIAAARRAVKEQSLSSARFIAGDVRVELEKLTRAECFDLIVLDPPRSGARDVLPEVIRRAPGHIAYCACDPVTLARDLRALCDAGYALDRVTGFDMFPQTHHFETLAWLTRSS